MCFLLSLRISFDFICDAGKNKGIFTEPVLQELISMVKLNLFRALPPKQRDNSGGSLFSIAIFYVFVALK